MKAGPDFFKKADKGKLVPVPGIDEL